MLNFRQNFSSYTNVYISHKLTPSIFSSFNNYYLGSCLLNANRYSSFNSYNDKNDAKNNAVNSIATDLVQNNDILSDNEKSFPTILEQKKIIEQSANQIIARSKMEHTKIKLQKIIASGKKISRRIDNKSQKISHSATFSHNKESTNSLNANLPSLFSSIRKFSQYYPGHNDKYSSIFLNIRFKGANLNFEQEDINVENVELLDVSNNFSEKQYQEVKLPIIHGKVKFDKENGVFDDIFPIDDSLDNPSTEKKLEYSSSFSEDASFALQIGYYMLIQKGRYLPIDHIRVDEDAVLHFCIPNNFSEKKYVPIKEETNYGKIKFNEKTQSYTYHIINEALDDELKNDSEESIEDEEYEEYEEFEEEDDDENHDDKKPE